MNMKMKLSILTSLLIILVIGSISGVLFFFDEKVLLENKKENQSILFGSFVKICEDAMILDDKLLLLDFCSMLKQTNLSIIYILFIDANGNIISSGKSEMVYFATQKLGRRGVKTRHGYLLREAVGPGGDEIVDFTTNIKNDGINIGTAQMGFSTTMLKQELTAVIVKMRKMIIFGALGAILLGIIISFLFASHIMKPIKRLADAAGHIGSGNFDHRIPISLNDEFGWLTKEFNKMGDKLSELDQMKNDFISNVTHELRSPLGSIKSYMDLIEKDEEKYPALKDYISRIQNNIRRLTIFVDNLLDVSRIEQGKYALKMNPSSLDIVASKVIKNFEAQAKGKNIRLESKISSVLPKVAADPNAIEQVFTNLINNALKFTPAEGKITIDAKEISKSSAPHFGGRHICVSVNDTGHGIHPSDMKRIFNKFEQARYSKGAFHGTGLGLSIVKGIIEAHGGKVWVDSNLDKGTTFYFTLNTSAAAEV